MFSTIIIGVDGGPGGRDALALARELASPSTALVAVSAAIVRTHPEEGADRDYDSGVKAAAETRLADTLADEHGVRGEVLFAHSPAAALHAAADRHGADLIVVGCSRRGPIGRIVAGDDTRETLRQAPCAVAVAPRDHVLADARLRTIGVGWDGSAQAGRALALAQAVAQSTGATVHALTVSAGPMWPPLTDEPDVVKLVTAEVDPGATHVPELDGVHATEATLVAADELAAFDAEVDLLVIGSKRRGPLERLVLGSTAERLLRDCPHPLIVVPRVAESAAAPAG